MTPQRYHLSIFFKNDTLVKFEDNTMPTETEFVGVLASSSKPSKVPSLEATPEALERFQKERGPVSADGDKPAAPPVAPRTSYPPLEPAVR